MELSAQQSAEDLARAAREALAAGAREQAIDLSLNAISYGSADPVVRSLMAEALECDGRWDEALRLLEESLRLTPHDPQAPLALARGLVRRNRAADGAAVLAPCLDAPGPPIEALLLGGELALALRRPAEAAWRWSAAARMAPDVPGPQAELAALHAQQGRWVLARAAALAALALDAASPKAALALARADLGQGDVEAALARLAQQAARRDLTPEDRAHVLTYLGDALLAAGRPARAFLAWREREAASAGARAAALAAGRADFHVDVARRITLWLQTHPGLPAGPADPIDGEAAGHVFLCSFPRSGATALEQVIAAHPGAAAMDEAPCLSSLVDPFLVAPGGLDRLAALTARELADLRARYWAAATREIGRPLEGLVLVDKNPFDSLKAAAIARLFPRARILFALRDPRDVVLSCWRRLYYSQMAEFHTLELTAACYDAAMTQWVHAARRLPLPVREVRHERLVEDPAGEARAALAFVGLPWREDVLDFSRARIVSITPSAAQLGRGLNRDGVGQWRLFEGELAPVLPRLAPWVERFGYPSR